MIDRSSDPSLARCVQDRALIAHPKFSSLWVQDMRESVRQGGAAHAEEVALHVRDWGFALSDLFRRSARRPGLWQRWFGKARDDDEVVSLPVHIWQVCIQVYVASAFVSQSVCRGMRE